MEKLRDLKVTEVITSEGGIKIEFDGFCYHLKYHRKDKFHWTCEHSFEEMCYARIITQKGDDGHVVRTINNDHSHARRDNILKLTRKTKVIAQRDLRVTEIKTNRGRVKIKVDGFFYHFNTYRNDIFYWVCEFFVKEKCHARVSTHKEDDRHVVRSVTNCHSHPRRESIIKLARQLKTVIAQRHLRVTELKTNRGVLKIEVNGFGYHLIRSTPSTSRYYWLCELVKSKYKCDARLKTIKENDSHVVLSVTSYHNHPRRERFIYKPEDMSITQWPTGKNEAANRVQLIRLVEALKLNPEVAKGICPEALKRKKFKDFSIELNALGPPQMKWNEWFKVWAFWKKELLKKSVCPPGRPFNPNDHLSEFEQTIIQIIYSSNEQSEVSVFEPDELFNEEESDLISESEKDEVEIIEIDDDEESFDISKEPLDPSALAYNEAFSSSIDGFEDSQSWQNEPTSSRNVQPENSDTLALHEIKSEEEEEEVVEQNIQRYDSSESLEGHVEEFLNMKDELQTIKNCHQKILQDQISSEKDFHSKVLNFMGEIKTSMENIESHLKINLEKNDALIAFKKENVEAYRQAQEDKLADKQAKLQLQFQLLDSKKRKLVNLMVKKES